MGSAGRSMAAVVNGAVAAGGWEEAVLGESAWSEGGHRLDVGDGERKHTEWAPFIRSYGGQLRSTWCVPNTRGRRSNRGGGEMHPRTREK